jgi:exodeoxyribonuclease VII large subunit
LIENDLKYQKKLRSLYLENSLNNINALDSEINAKINIAIDDGMKKISSMWQAICLNMINKVSVKDDKINAFQDSLEAKNPVNIMKKGYAVIKDKNNKIITSRNDVKRNDCIKINFLNDEIIAIVEKNIDY